MILFTFCDCHWLIPWLLPFIIGSFLGWLLGSRSGRKETVVEEKIVYKDKIVYQDKIIYKDPPSVSGEAAKISSTSDAKPTTVGEKGGASGGRITTKKVSSISDKDKEDDYLSCKEYEGREINDKVNNVAMFKHDRDGQYYFALYNVDKSVKLRSEGFKTSLERDQELSGVLRFHDDESKYKTIKKGKYSMKVLYDDTGREVGRSCLITADSSSGKSKTAKTIEAVTATSTSKSTQKEKVVDQKSTTKASAVTDTKAPRKKNIYAGLKNDNFQIVEGVGPKMDEVLKKHEIKSWADLAAKTPEQVRALLDKEHPTRYKIIDPLTWPEQARLANDGKWDELIAYQKRLDSGRVDRGDGATDAKVEKLLIKMGLLKKWKKDDLKAVEGIGPKIEGLLNDAGIKTWKALSGTSVSSIQDILDKAGSRYKLADPGSWPKQAELAAAGKWDDLQEYQNFLVGGK